LHWQKNINIADAFHKAHEARYGYAQPANTVEIVSCRLRSSGVVEKLKMTRTKISKTQTAKPHDYKQVFFSSKSERTAIYKRENLQAGMKLVSPCIVTEYSATTLIPRSAFASVDEFDNLIIKVE
jgi:N-methylhydantoinase A